MKVELGVDDRAYQVRVINSNRLDNRPASETEEEASTQIRTDSLWVEEIKKGQMDSEVTTFKVEAGATYFMRYVIHEKRLYYLSGKDEEIRLRLYVPKGLSAEILEQCHERMGHMGIVKTCDLVGRTYWPELYGEVTIYIWGWDMPDPE